MGYGWAPSGSDLTSGRFLEGGGAASAESGSNSGCEREGKGGGDRLRLRRRSDMQAHIGGRGPGPEPLLGTLGHLLDEGHVPGTIGYGTPVTARVPVYGQQQQAHAYPQAYGSQSAQHHPRLPASAANAHLLRQQQTPMVCIRWASAAVFVCVVRAPVCAVCLIVCARA